jgi:hypothetical protein
MHDASKNNAATSVQNNAYRSHGGQERKNTRGLRNQKLSRGKETAQCERSPQPVEENRIVAPPPPSYIPFGVKAQSPSVSPSEFGYLQINEFALKDRKSKVSKAKPGPKQWVSLPSGTKVVKYPCTDPDSNDSPRSNVSERSKDTASTTASVDSVFSLPSFQGDTRRVRFVDGSSPACDDEESSNAKLADWIYIDRDICGVSLYSYCPNNAEYADFASSPFAYSFTKDLTELVSHCRSEQREARTNRDYLQTYYDEEIALHKALSLAGVHEGHLESEIVMSSNTPPHV